MMSSVRGIRMGIWRGISRLSWPKLLVILAFNVVIISVIWPSGEDYDMSHLEQRHAYYD